MTTTASEEFFAKNLITLPNSSRFLKKHEKNLEKKSSEAVVVKQYQKMTLEEMCYFYMVQNLYILKIYRGSYEKLTLVIQVYIAHILSGFKYSHLTWSMFVIATLSVTISRTTFARLRSSPSFND